MYACVDTDFFFDTSPLRADFKPVDGPLVSIFSGHRGVVPIAAGAQFAVDVEQAIGGTSHEEETMKVLLRRVELGE